MKYIELKEVDSTNAYCSDMLLKGEITESTIVYAYSQKNGKGMGKNKWESDEGMNALFSLVLFPDIKTSEIFKISVATSLAIYDYLILKGVKSKIKWPNDIYYNNKKLGGILVENKLLGGIVKSSIIGVGLNINQENFSIKLPNPISLKNITGKTFDINEEIKLIAEMIEKRIFELKDKSYDSIRLDYLLKLYKFGEIAMFKIKGIKNEISGSIIDVKSSGKIVVQAVSGQLCECDLKQIQYIELD